MSDKELQAAECVRQKQWSQAVQLYDQILNNNYNYKCPKDKIISCLMGRSECNVELEKYDAVLQDCRKLIKLVNESDRSNVGARARQRLVRSLFKLKRFNEAEQSCREWLNSSYCSSSNTEISKVLERLRTVLQMANGQKNNQRVSQQRLDDEMLMLDEKLESCIISNPLFEKNIKILQVNNQKNTVNSNHSSDKHRKHLLVPQDSKRLNPDNNNATPVNSFQKQIEQIGNQSCEGIRQDASGSESCVCSYCSVTFNDRAALRAHCQTQQHQTVIMSDEGREWRWRPPPRGFTTDTYGLCDSWNATNYCRYGAQCVEAHGSDELIEWKERFEYRKLKMQKACEKELYGKSYTEQLLDKWIQATTPDKIMKEKLEGVDDSCTAALVTTVSSKVSKREWTFILKTRKNLRAVALLQDTHRTHFVIKQVLPGESKINKKGRENLKLNEPELTSDQEWSVALGENTEPTDNSAILEHRVKVQFSTDIYGTFRQAVVFDLGTEPVLVKHLCVDVVPVGDADKIKEIRKEMTMSTVERWDTCNSNIVPFNSPVYPGLATPHAPGDGETERILLNAYPAPRADTFTLTQGTVIERCLTKANYKSRMHELLYVEELARLERVAKYNVTCRLRVAPSYLLAPSGMAASTAKYAHAGELFALLSLSKDISEDTSAGRLILNNCTTVLLGAPASPTETSKRKVYEALIEDKGKNMVYLRLPSVAVTNLGLIADTEYNAEVQFQLNRLTYCEWHYAVDKITDYSLLFPDISPEPNIPWTPHRQWSETLDSRLNSKQKEAVVAITTPTNIPLPPILLIGPFGTGKTYTLAQAIKQLLLQSDSRILICTHSNSAADLYIKDYLHPWFEGGLQEAKPLRIYYHKRWVATVNQVVQKYCLIETANGARSFRLPSLEDIMAHRIIVVTLSTSMYLATLGLPKGFFTHILLDEAAQAMESEALMPLALVGQGSRVVLAGDHMQLSPELFSQFACERHLHISLLERLYEHYPPSFPCKILLCENYRAHEAIVGFTSELFYEQKLVASGRQPRHDKFYPLTFFTTRGEDVQDHNSTAFYNNSEVYEVVERVCELRRRWPAAWGRLDEHSIGIMTPYADQVFRIRSELRKRRMGGISVERVLNVQGKQFRAVFLSTVRTRRTCSAPRADYGFLSNRKLLNTAITRAQSLVAVIGDPVALCSVGRCRKLWERFIRICHDNRSLFGITWGLLRSQLDGLEFKKTYSLNPLAPEFIPRAMQTEAYIKMRPPEMAPATPQAPLVVPPRPTPSVPLPVTPSIVQYPPVYYYPTPPTYAPPRPPQPSLNIPQPVQHAPFSSAPVATANWSLPTYPVHSPIERATPTWVNKPAPKRSEVTVSTTARLAPPNPQLVYAQSAPPPRISPESAMTSRGAVPPELLAPFAVAQLSRPPPPVKLADQGHTEREPIQFLQNVHFPERANPSAGAREEAREAQMLWYRHLLETQGAESARRFLQLTTQPVPSAPPPVRDHLHAEDFATSINEMFSDRTLGQPPRQSYELVNGHAGPRSAAEAARGWRTEAPRAEPPAERLEAEYGREAGVVPTTELCWLYGTSGVRSVPLYRRGQVAEGGEASAGAFAGYARALSLQTGAEAPWGELLRTYASVLRDEPPPSTTAHALYHYFN